MRAIDYLKSIKQYQSKIDLRKQQLMSMTDVSAVSYDHQPSASDPNSNERKILNKMALEDEIDKLIQQYSVYLNEAVARLEMLPTPEGHILYLRYVNHKQLRYISRKVNYSVSQTKRYISSGIYHMQEILDNEGI